MNAWALADQGYEWYGTGIGKTSLPHMTRLITGYICHKESL